jgi:hypothetical protein
MSSARADRFEKLYRRSGDRDAYRCDTNDAHHPPATVEWVIIEYLKSRQWAELASTTRKFYRGEFDLMRGRIGRRMLTELETEDVELYCAQIDCCVTFRFTAQTYFFAIEIQQGPARM